MSSCACARRTIASRAPRNSAFNSGALRPRSPHRISPAWTSQRLSARFIADRDRVVLFAHRIVRAPFRLTSLIDIPLQRTPLACVAQPNRTTAMKSVRSPLKQTTNPIETDAEGNPMSSSGPSAPRWTAVLVIVVFFGLLCLLVAAQALRG